MYNSSLLSILPSTVGNGSSGTGTCITIECQIQDLKDNMDVLFQLLCAFIMFFMQCGFAFLECGSVRAKNTTNILIKNLLDSFVAGLAYYSIGYAFAFGEGNSFVGYNKFFMIHLPEDRFAKWFFNFVYAATASTIVSGAMAERCDFTAYLIYSFVLTGAVFPIVSHWAWTDDGWLKSGDVYTDVTGTIVRQIGYQDFAGSGVVHLVGGVAALIGCLLLGPRIGRFDEDDEDTPVDIKGHSVPLAALGGFILVFGFLALTAGKQQTISSPGDGAVVAAATVNTVIAASCGAFTTLILNKTRWFGDCRWSLLTTLNGSLAGMVAICAGANVFYPWAAAITGTLAALFYMALIWIVLRCRIDDPLDVVGVHLGGGFWGVLTVPLFKKDTGIVFSPDRFAFLALGWNVCGLVSIVGWTSVICLIMFGLLKRFGILRVSEEIELKGLDVPKHGEPAYPSESYEHGWGEKDDAIRNMVQMSTASAMPVPDVKPKGSLTQLTIPRSLSGSNSLPVTASRRNTVIMGAPMGLQPINEARVSLLPDSSLNRRANTNPSSPNSPMFGFPPSSSKGGNNIGRNSSSPLSNNRRFTTD